MQDIMKVKGQPKWVVKYAEYTNGFDTSGGFYTSEELEETTQDELVASITYNSEHATELPYDFDELYFLDDNSKRQKIKEIHWDRNNRRYEMEDGFFSEEVTV